MIPVLLCLLPVPLTAVLDLIVSEEMTTGWAKDEGWEIPGPDVWTGDENDEA